MKHLQRIFAFSIFLALVMSSASAVAQQAQGDIQPMQPAQKIMRGSQPAQNTGTQPAQNTGKQSPPKTNKLFTSFSTPHGGSNRTFVSAARGRDSNAPTCGPATPCRSFQVAIDNTDVGGEVVVLDAGGYGSFTVSQSVKVNAGGFYAGISVPGANSPTNGVIVNAGQSDEVSLVGLTINGSAPVGPAGATAPSSGTTGIDFQGGAALHIENSVVDGFNTGINATGNYCTSANSRSSLYVSNTVVRNNGTSGINLATAGGLLYTTINHAVVKDSGENVVNGDGSPAPDPGSCASPVNCGDYTSNTCDLTTISDSVISGGSFGIYQQDGTGRDQMSVEHSVISGNGNGLQNAGGNPVHTAFLASNNFITNNTTGVGGEISSFGNNVLMGNHSDNAFTNTYPTH